MENILFENTNCFDELGIEQVESIVFKKRNLLIGKNGAGKSRFLNGLQSYLKDNKKNDIMVAILDFSTFHLNGGNQSVSENVPDMYDVFFNNESADFSDFLNLINCGNEVVLEDLTKELSMHARITKQKAGENLRGINDFLLDLIGYQIILENNKIEIEKFDDIKQSVRRLPYGKFLKLFSPGERFIFYLSFFLFFVKAKTEKKLVLLMDEPELHLHPQILLKIMRWLYDSNMIDELWVASHSLFLVPLFKFEELIVFKDGKILKRNSRTYHKLYNDLVGLDDIKLFEFLKSIDDWQYYQFIVECFCLPEPVKKIDVKDEQYIEFKDSLPKHKNSYRVLDFGAGKFRLWECLQNEKNDNQSEYDCDRMKYEAYEPYPETDKEKDLPFKLYTNDSDIPEDYYDAVILMNVLHEIDILEWEKTFSLIKKVLKEDGILVFLEVFTLNLGEQPYGDNGYLVLGDDEVRTMFSTINYPKKKGEKSNCWIIPAMSLKNVSKNHINDAIEKLKNKSKEILENAFNQKIEFAHKQTELTDSQLPVRKYAFWSQQYINALFALDRLKPKEKGYNSKNKRKTPSKEDEKIPYPGLV